MKRLWLLAGAALAAWLVAAAPAPRGGGNDRGAVSFHTDVPAHPLDVIVARPTDTAVTFSPLAYADLRGTLVCAGRSRALTLRAGVPSEVVLDGLQPDTAYPWELSTHLASARGAFHTQRRPGAAFTFTITADSHLDDQTVPELYARSLRNAAADAPDFHLDLGDTFMTEKYPGDFHAARSQYFAQRYYFGLLGAPLYLVLGNHDGEAGWLLGDGPDNIARWSLGLRKALFPNPEPGGLYTGNATPVGASGLPQNYYAWDWGDAQFVVLDPFWPTTTRPRRDSTGWVRTLGRPQYDWLARTLAGSRAKYRFVFIHHLVGGVDANSRGGAEAAPLFEWGGANADGTPGFARQRPGWPEPVADLLRRHRVTAVFHGHDHFYARQEHRGLVYQMVPQPGHPGRRADNHAAEYGYKSGEILGGSGHVRVKVAPAGATVEFVRAVLPADEQGEWRNGAVGGGYGLGAE